MEKGQWIQHDVYEVRVDQGAIDELNGKKQFKYLGYLQTRYIDHRLAKQTTTDA